MSRKDTFRQIVLGILILCLLIVSTMVIMEDSLSANELAKNTKITINAGENVTIEGLASPLVVGVDQYYGEMPPTQPDSISYIAGLMQNHHYNNLGFSFLVDWTGKIKIIDIWHEAAITEEGISVGDDFEKVKKAYGQNFQKITPYEDRPEQISQNNRQTIIYHTKGIIFYGTTNPSRVICISILPPKVARYTRYIRL